MILTTIFVFLVNDVIGNNFIIMVLLNYEKFIEDKLNEQAEKMLDPNLAKACHDKDFK